MTRPLRIACLQTRPRASFDAALDEALGLAETAVGQGAEFLALPEYCGGLRTDGATLAPPAAAEDAHPVLRGLSDFARARGVWMLVGSLAVTGPAGKIRNRGYVLDAAGSVVSRYDKIHLFDVRLSDTEIYQESARVAGGGTAVLVETTFGRLGCTICYDLRFPQLYRTLAQAGAEMLAVPAAFTRTTGRAHWHVLNRARAIENGAFVIAPCATGEIDGGGASYGHSLIVDPWGEVLADGGEAPGVVAAIVDFDRVAEARRRIPSLAHDRDFAAPTTTRRVVA